MTDIRLFILRIVMLRYNNNKILKIDLMKVIRFSVKGMRKEQKKTGTKKIDRRKEKKNRKILFIFIFWGGVP